MTTKNPEALRPPKQVLVKLLAVVLLSASMLMMLPRLLTLPAGNDVNLLKMFNEHAQIEHSKATRDDLPALAYALSGYLAYGAPDSLDEFSLPGQETPAFSEVETLHLKDVKALFDQAKTLFYAGLVLFAGLVVLIFFFGSTWRQRRMIVACALRWAAVVCVLILLLMVLMTSFNFSSAFFLFHEVLFDNELWLLNPQTDLLVQLMPEPFFLEYAKDFVVTIGIVFFVILLVTSLVIFLLKAGKHNEA